MDQYSAAATCIRILSLFIIILLSLTLSVNSKSIVKNLPGFPGHLPFTLETGYVGVGPENETQLFYYFVESQRDPANDPLLLYLPGGPGCSALFPILYQIVILPHMTCTQGYFCPLNIRLDSSGWNNVTLGLNPNSWTKGANVIFLDLPAGVGFSYATTWEGGRSSDSILALRTYEFLKKWFLEHPKFLQNPLYISGISYMGILVPIVTMEVYQGNEDGNQPKLNIKGYLVLNPLTDRFIDINSRLEFAYRVALISDDIYKSTKEACNGNYVDTDPSNTLCSNNLQRFDECTSDINFSNIIRPVCDDINPDPDCPGVTMITMNSWANNKEVQKALYVRAGTIGLWEKINNTIHYTFGKNDTVCYSYDIPSTVDYHKQLTTRNCQALIISGDHDLTFPHVGTEQWVKSLNVPVERPWNPWFVDNQVAGYQITYAKTEYSLLYATIKGAGHSVSSDKPREASVLVNEWLASHTYISDS